MGFKAGQVANPHGRPPTQRALADTLRAASQERLKVGRHFYTRAEYLSKMIWEGLTYAETKTADGKVIKLSATAWIDFVKFYAAHTDGPARIDLDLTSGGQPVKAFIGFSPDEWDAETTTIDAVPQPAALGDGKRT